MRRPGPIAISVDNSPGFKTLSTNKDQELNKLGIEITKTDELNKNANAIVDKACQELEEELKRLKPEGEIISNATLKLAIKNLNSKLRRKGTLSAYEINCARDQYSGENLTLNDEMIREKQLERRQDNRQNAAVDNIQVGDTVKLKNRNHKHKANEIFLVTDTNNEDVTIQKILHPLTDNPTKIMGNMRQERNY